MAGNEGMFDRLAANLTGTVTTSSDPGYEGAARAWNLAVEQRPLAVVGAVSVDDVVATVQFAHSEGIPVAPQGTGHGAAAVVGLERAILLRTDAIDRVTIDADRRVARAGAGALWRSVTEPAGEFGLAALHGSSPTVGVAGYTLGGGHGWLGRKHGLACNSVISMQVVTADGQKRQIDSDSEADLFWALRGGGGSFAIVTEIEFELQPISRVYAGCLMLPAEAGPAMLSLFAEWTPSLPEAMNASVRYLALPPTPDVPEPLRGKRVVDLTATFIGDESEGAELIAPFRELADSIMDTFATVPAASLPNLNQDPEDPVPAVTDGAPLKELTAETLARIDELVGPQSDSPALAFQIRHLGGALEREPDGAGALAKLPGSYMYGDVCALIGPPREAIEAHLGAVREGLAPWACEQLYFNFADSPHDPSEIFPAECFDRLRAVKHRYDPDGLILAAHQIPVGQGAASTGTA